MSGREGGRGGRKGGKKKGVSQIWALCFKSRNDNEKKTTNKNQIMDFSFRTVTTEKQPGPRYLKQQHAKSTEI